MASCCMHVSIRGWTENLHRRIAKRHRQLQVVTSTQQLTVRCTSADSKTLPETLLARWMKLESTAMSLSDAQIFQRYIETKDGVTSSNTIVPQETSVGDSWVCQVTPNDAWQDGAPQTSNTLNVVAGNGMPHIDWYSPVNVAQTVDEGASLNFNQISSDPNGDVLSYSWTLDTVQASNNTELDIHPRL